MQDTQKHIYIDGKLKIINESDTDMRVIGWTDEECEALLEFSCMLAF